MTSTSTPKKPQISLQLPTSVKLQLNSSKPLPSPSKTPSNEEILHPWWHHFTAGEVAGMIGSIFCHPFDTTKCRIQMLNTTNKPSTFQFMKQTVLKNGPLSLYNGLLYPFIGYGVLFSIAFGVNGVCQDYFIYQHNIKNENDMITDSSQLSLPKLVVGGAAAGFASSFFRTPVERVKVWSQIHHTSTMKSTIHLLKQYGLVKGLMGGLYPTMSREIPQFAVYYAIYEFTCKLLCNGNITSKKDINSSYIFLSGASAGIGCWIITYPIDVIKTRIQASGPGVYKNMIHCAKDIYKETGSIKPFFNGLAPTVYRAAILHSAVFLLYERVLDFLHMDSSKD